MSVRNFSSSKRDLYSVHPDKIGTNYVGGNEENARQETFGMDFEIVRYFLGDNWRDVVADLDKDVVITAMGDPSDGDSMAWLVSSLKRFGLKSAILGFEDKGRGLLVAADGNRRTVAWRIGTWLGYEMPQKVDFVNVGSSTGAINPVDVILTQLMTRSNTFSLGELGELAARLKAMTSYTDAEIAEIAGIPQNKLDRAELYHQAPIQLKRKVEEGTLAESGVVTAMTAAKTIAPSPTRVGETALELVEEAEEANGGGKTTIEDIKVAASNRSESSEPKKMTPKVLIKRLIEEGTVKKTTAGYSITVDEELYRSIFGD